MAGFLRGVLVRLRSSLLQSTCILKLTKVKKSLLGKLFPPNIKIYRDLTLAFRSCGHVFVKGQFSSRSKITVQYFTKMDQVK